jgi:hypothetical protein
LGRRLGPPPWAAALGRRLGPPPWAAALGRRETWCGGPRWFMVRSVTYSYPPLSLQVRTPRLTLAGASDELSERLVPLVRAGVAGRRPVLGIPA